MEYPQEHTVTLSDGIPRPIRFSNGSLKRLKRLLNVSSLKGLFDQEWTEIVAPLIHEGLVEKDLTVEQIDELIPLHGLADVQAEVMAAFTGKTVEELKKVQSQSRGAEPEETVVEAEVISTGFANGAPAASLESLPASSGV